MRECVCCVCVCNSSRIYGWHVVACFSKSPTNNNNNQRVSQQIDKRCENVPLISSRWPRLYINSFFVLSFDVHTIPLVFILLRFFVSFHSFVFVCVYARDRLFWQESRQTHIHRKSDRERESDPKSTIYEPASMWLWSKDMWVRRSESEEKRSDDEKKRKRRITINKLTNNNFQIPILMKSKSTFCTSRHRLCALCSLCMRACGFFFFWFQRSLHIIALYCYMDSLWTMATCILFAQLFTFVNRHQSKKATSYTHKHTRA